MVDFLSLSTLIVSLVDFASTIILGCLGGQFRSDCCFGLFRLEHRAAEDSGSEIDP